MQADLLSRYTFDLPAYGRSATLLLHEYSLDSEEVPILPEGRAREATQLRPKTMLHIPFLPDKQISAYSDGCLGARQQFGPILGRATIFKITIKGIKCRQPHLPYRDARATARRTSPAFNRREAGIRMDKVFEDKNQERYPTQFCGLKWVSRCIPRPSTIGIILLRLIYVIRKKFRLSRNCIFRAIRF